MKIECPIDFMDLDILGFIDHNITINIIKDSEIVEKKALHLPKKITNVIRCKNPRCITSIEQELEHIFDHKKAAKVSSALFLKLRRPESLLPQTSPKALLPCSRRFLRIPLVVCLLLSYFFWQIILFLLRLPFHNFQYLQTSLRLLRCSGGSIPPRYRRRAEFCTAPGVPFFWSSDWYPEVL